MPERITPTDADWWPDYGWEHLQRYAFATRYCTSGHGLDFGCGVGYGTEILARSGATTMTGVDIDAAIIAAALDREHPVNATFQTSLETATAEVPAGFDFAVMFEVIEHLREPRAVLAELADRLKPGGLLIVSAPNKLRFTGAPDPLANDWHLSEPTYADLHAWVSDRFDVIGEYEQSDLRLDSLDYVVGTLQRSWVLRLERGLRRLFGRPLVIPPPADLLVRKTDILPLILERRGICRQFIFVARRR
ncbi:MAG: methyltransferase domain-containing protein [Candidatus Didemnitutus sp.]|nr:methyltransferase domain-containing protein [Candidatus Didemnitutus sp.]